MVLRFRTRQTRMNSGCLIGGAILAATVLARLEFNLSLFENRDFGICVRPKSEEILICLAGVHEHFLAMVVAHIQILTSDLLLLVCRIAGHMPGLIPNAPKRLGDSYRLFLDGPESS